MATTSEEVWQLLGELIEAQKETRRLLQEQAQEAEKRSQEAEKRSQEAERRFQETEQLMREQAQEAEKRFQETEQLMKEQAQEAEKRFQETEQLMREQAQEAEKRFQETERLMKEQNRQLSQQIGKLGNRLGEFVEWQVRPAAVRLFQERGINIHELYPEISVQRPEGGLEIDLLVVNQTEAILIEVKSKLNQRDVDEHLERLAKFKTFMPRFQDVRALGAVAAMIVSSEVMNYAVRKGLFVIAQSGENVIILNDENFKPKSW